MAATSVGWEPLPHRSHRWLQGIAQALKLSLHPDKTRIVDLRDGADGFDFLGLPQVPAPVESMECGALRPPAIAHC